MQPIHRKDEGRFVIELEEGEAELSYRKVSEDTLDFAHTYVPPEARGGGVASSLVTAGFEYARKHGYKVLPSCPYVAAWLERHQEYADIAV